MLGPFRIPGKIIIDKHDVSGTNRFNVCKHIFDLTVDVLAVFGAVITEIAAKGTSPAGMNHITVQIFTFFQEVISRRYDLITGKRLLTAVNRL